MRAGYGHMVHDYYVSRLRQMHIERSARLSALSTAEEALAYQQRVRSAIGDIFGPAPDKTPLNARVVGHIDRPGYRIERILLESRPGCLVTANLYLPERLTAPAPAVLGTCGHSAEGKAADLYQGFCQRLVRNGFVVLIYDPFNQGERDQYADLPEREAVRACTAAHNMMGKQLELVGENLAMWRAWDGIRCLDYLLSRPEVDAQHVGLTGNSGGGTMTTWLWPLDERFTMAAPGCFVTTFLHNLENELPADCEQYPHGVLGAGLEMADMFVARAPAPVLLLGQHYDFFDRRGHQQACEELRRFYGLLGAEKGRIECYRGPHGHGYFRENQEAMVRFFARHAGREEIVTIEETEVLSPSELYATPDGDVLAAGARPIYALIADKARELATRRSAPDADAQRVALRRVLADALALPAERAVPHYRVLRPRHTQEGHSYARYAVETEENVRAILHKRLIRSEHDRTLDVESTVRLYLPHLASEEDLAHDAMALDLQGQGDLYALDVRGLGESLPDEEGSFWQPYGLDYMFHGHGLMFGESYLGRRVYDALRTLDLLAAEGASRIHLYGRGQGALIALFVAVLDDRVTTVTLKNAPASYAEWIEAPLAAWPAANMLPNALASFDLPDCLRVLGDRVTLLEPWDVQMQPAAPTRASE